jgi:hypothetical protein
VYLNGQLDHYIKVFEKPCPPHLRAQLDEAFGRPHRLRIEGSTIDDWIETVLGIKIGPPGIYELWKVEEAFARYRSEKAAETPTTPTKPGPEAVTRERVENALRNQIANQELTIDDLRKMTWRAGGIMFGVSPETFNSARKNVLNTDQTGK